MLRETGGVHENHTQDGWSPGKDLKPGSAKYKAKYQSPSHNVQCVHTQEDICFDDNKASVVGHCIHCTKCIYRETEVDD
jgi:hypothetical protein